MMWNMNEWWGWGMGFGWIVPLIFIGLVVWAVVSLSRRQNRRETENSALAILKERYARGELSREEYESMRRDLD